MHVVPVDGRRVERIAVSDGTVRVNTWYAGHLSSEVEPGAQAFSVQMETPFTNLRAHFHDVAQFQVFVAGSGSLGARPIGPMTVFYTDAFTSYGPIKAGAEGLTFFTLRCEHDAGVRWMPEARGRREPSAGRRIVVPFDPADSRHLADAVLVGRLRRQVVERHDDGMGVEFVVAGPNTSLAPVFDVPSPRQYVLVLSGEVIADGQRLRPMGLMYSEDVAERSEVGTADVGAMIALMTFPAA
jgi:hypothetical protein